jgi:rRNA-processing protein FCF1
VCRFPYELRIVEGTLEELNKLIEKGDSKEKKAAKFGLSLIKQYKVGIINKDEGDVDSTIAALPKGTVVATQDMELKRRLKEKGHSLLVLRQQKYLQLVEN